MRQHTERPKRATGGCSSDRLDRDRRPADVARDRERKCMQPPLPALRRGRRNRVARGTAACDVPRGVQAAMMRVYVVPDEAIRAAGFAPNRSLRFPAGSYEPVADPRAADVILPGVDLFALKSREEFLRVPCVREHEARTAHFDCADNYAAYKSTAILVRGNLSRERLADSPNSVAWPWPTEDFRAHGVQAATPGAFSHDVGFHGWDYSDTCKAAIQSCQRTFDTRFDLAAYHDFAGYLWKDGKPLPEFTRRREGFVASLARC